MEQTPTDAELIAASREDARVFEGIFERHFDAVFRYLRRRVGADVADDLSADVFAAAFRARDRYDTTRVDARPWLYGIATNLLRQHYRDEERELAAYARTGVDPLAADDGRVGRVEAPASRAVADALASLPPVERETLLLHAWAELELHEIADALGVPAATVRTRLHRARTRLRERLARDAQYVDGATTNDG